MRERINTCYADCFMKKYRTTGALEVLEDCINDYSQECLFFCTLKKICVLNYYSIILTYKKTHSLIILLPAKEGTVHIHINIPS